MLSSKRFTLFALTVFMVSSVGTEEVEAKTVVHVHQRTPTIYDFFLIFFFEVQNIQDSQWAILLVLSKWVSVLQHGLPYSDWLQNQLWIATVITALLYFKRLKRQFSEDGRTLIRSGMENKDVKSNKPPLGRLKRSDSEEIPSSEATGRYIKVPSDHHIV